MDSETALLLIAHGSRQEEANADLFSLVQQLHATGRYAIVEAAFLELAAPDIAQGGQRCVVQGARQVILVPYFLSAGIHVRRDLAEACRQLQAQFPSVHFCLAEPLGRHPLLAEIVAQRAAEAAQQLHQPAD